MTGIPSIVVKLDDGTGTYPYTITQYVRLVEGITWSRGRPDEQQSVSPGQLSMTLENTDGRFSQGTGTYNPQPDRLIQLTVSSQVRWTGRVQSWPVAWPTGGDEYATVQITAVDDLARAARRTLSSSLVEEITLDSPGAYWPLSEATGATMGSDISGNNITPMQVVGSAPNLTFGTGTGPAGDGSAAVQMFAGQYLSSGNYTTILPATGWSLEFWVLVPSAPASSTTLAHMSSSLTGALGTFVTVTTSGFVSCIAAGTINIADNHTHHVAITYDGTTVRRYVDGVADGTSASALTDYNVLDIGGPASSALSLLALTGTVAQVATYTSVLSAGRIASHYQAGSSDFSGETPTARITRMGSYANIPVGTLDTASTALMGPTQQSGRSALDVLNDISDATQGIVFVGANGSLTNVTGRTIQLIGFATKTHDANWVTPDTAVMVDMAQVINLATGLATGSENVTTAKNAASITAHGVYPKDFTWNVSTDAQATDLTNWQVANNATPTARVPSLTYDVLTMGATPLSNALGLELGIFASVTSMPSQSPAGDLYVIVQGIAETLSTDTWQITTNCSRYVLVAAWILGDGFYGILGASTQLSY